AVRPRARPRAGPRAPRVARRNASGPRTAPPAPPCSAAAVAGARVRGEQQRHVIVACRVVDSNGQLNSAEEGRRGVEADPVFAGLEGRGRELRNPSVLVRLVGGGQVAAAVELAASPPTRPPALGVRRVRADQPAVPYA